MPMETIVFAQEPQLEDNLKLIAHAHPIIQETNATPLLAKVQIRK